jgi:hypothetical protein
VGFDRISAYFRSLTGLGKCNLEQSLAGYEGVTDTEQLSFDQFMHHVVVAQFV